MESNDLEVRFNALMYAVEQTMKVISDKMNNIEKSIKELDDRLTEVEEKLKEE
jgi:uncharacterized membrane protein